MQVLSKSLLTQSFGLLNDGVKWYRLVVSEKFYEDEVHKHSGPESEYWYRIGASLCRTLLKNYTTTSVPAYFFQGPYNIPCRWSQLALQVHSSGCQRLFFSNQIQKALCIPSKRNHILSEPDTDLIKTRRACTHTQYKQNQIQTHKQTHNINKTIQ